MENKKKKKNDRIYQTKPDPEKYCEYCGKLMHRVRFSSGRLEDLSAFKRRKYCNRECMKRAYIKLKTEAGWTTAHGSARKVNELIKDGNTDTCEICGKVGKVDVHHKDENPQNNDPSNLKVLCRSCHMKIHHPKSKCIVPGCDNDMNGGLGYCNKHYIRFKKYGSPFIVRWNTKHTKFDKEVISHQKNGKKNG